jgi:3-hydroxybutyrate dehydrogenase
LRAKGTKVEFTHANLSQPDETQLLVRTALRTFGGLDILVNNAGKFHHDLIEEVPDNTWSDIININLSAAFYTIKTALPQMQKQKWGRIINISSVYGLVGSPSRAALVASKHGLIGITKTTAL